MLTVHGDDFTITGTTAGLDWMEKKMSEKYDIKSELLGPEASMKKEIKVLSRTITWRGVELSMRQTQDMQTW